MLAYGFHIFNFTLTIDAEFRDNYYQTISLGRWGHAFLRVLFLPEPFIPYFTHLISIAALCAAAVAISDILRHKGIVSYLFCALFITFPQMAYQFEFINQADTLSLGYLFSAMCVLFYFRARQQELLTRLTWLVLACACFVMAIAIYQTLIFVPPTILLAYLLVDSYETEKGFRETCAEVIRFAAFTIVSAFIYITMSSWVQHLHGIEAESSIVVGIDFQTGIWPYIQGSLFKMWQGLMGTSYFGFITFSVASLCTLVTLLKCFFCSFKTALIRAFLVISILVFPYLAVMATTHELPPRVFVAAGLSFSVLVINELRFFKSALVSVVLVAVLCLVNVSLINKLFYSDVIVREADVLMANRIRTLMAVKHPDFEESNTPVYFHGGISKVSKHKLPDSDVFGSSFFSWDGGNNLRIMAFFDYYGIASFRLAQEEEVLDVLDEINSMPTWPEYDAITMVNDVMVVKLGADVGWLPFDVE
nr:glucosyltransferase domain-containing protein [Halomonas populi]